MVRTHFNRPVVTPAGKSSAAGRRARGFSLIELVIVIVIIGIIAAIAIPRMSRGSAGAADAALSGNLSVLRNAIDLYHTEHGAYPTVADLEKQLTEYSNLAGGTKTSKDETNGYVYGPYLRKMPTVPVGPERGSKGVAAMPAAGDEDATASGIGWYFNPSTGDIKPASGGSKDANGDFHYTY